MTPRSALAWSLALVLSSAIGLPAVADEKPAPPADPGRLAARRTSTSTSIRSRCSGGGGGSTDSNDPSKYRDLRRRDRRRDPA